MSNSEGNGKTFNIDVIRYINNMLFCVPVDKFGQPAKRQVINLDTVSCRPTCTAEHCPVFLSLACKMCGSTIFVTLHTLLGNNVARLH